MSEPLPLPEASPSSADEARKGALYAVAAYLWWGFSVFYFKAVAGVPPLEIMAHRIVWSVPLLFAWLGWRGRLADVRRAVSDRRTLVILLITTALIAGNWLVFIIAVNSGRVTQASLGYYINPLVNVLLGVAFLGERLRGMQIAGVLLATAGVAFLTLSYGELPVMSLFLAGTFALYGLLRKTVRADGLTGLAIETSLLLPLALGFLVVQESRSGLAFVHGTWQETLLLPLGGLVTHPAAGLVRERRPAAAARHHRLHPVPLAEPAAPPRHRGLRRALHPRSSGDVRLHLARPRPLQRGRLAPALTPEGARRPTIGRRASDCA